MIYAPYGAARNCVRDPGSSELLHLKMFFEKQEVKAMNVSEKITGRPNQFPKATRDLAEKDDQAKVVSDGRAVIIRFAVGNDTISCKPKEAESPIISFLSGKINPSN